jgi:hypothetical protein
MNAELLRFEKDEAPFAASVYLRALMQAFSIFVESCANTRARSPEGGVKVFTFWIDREVAFSSVMSGNTTRPLSSCQMS